jgi:hypothetical protein
LLNEKHRSSQKLRNKHEENPLKKKKKKRRRKKQDREENKRHIRKGALQNNHKLSLPSHSSLEIGPCSHAI